MEDYRIVDDKIQRKYREGVAEDEKWQRNKRKILPEIAIIENKEDKGLKDVDQNPHRGFIIRGDAEQKTQSEK